MRRHSLLLSPLIPCLLLLPPLGCGDSGAGETDSDSESSDSAANTTGGNTSDLGDSVSQDCVDAMAQYAAFTAASGDSAAMLAAYDGTALQKYVQRLDGENGRVDDSAILDALNDGGELALIDASLWVMQSLLEGMRTYIAAPGLGTPDPYTVWDDGHCIWEGAWKPAALTAEGWSGDYVDVIAAEVDDGFVTGHDGLIGEPPAAALDEWLALPAKQIVEKDQYRVIHRHVSHFATLAQSDGDALAARRALRWFEMFEHRLEERNTPGIPIVKAMLAGEPDAIDPAVIIREMNVAFAKRTRTYASQALDLGEVGVPAGYKGSVEGSIYTKLLYPDMRDAGFDVAGIESSWDSYNAAIRDDDAVAAQTHSDALVQAYCEYQEQTLGISSCTGSDDEPGA